LNNEFLK